MLDVWVSFLRHSLRHFPEGNLVLDYTSTRTHIYQEVKISKKLPGTYVRIVYLVRVLVPGTRTYL